MLKAINDIFKTVHIVVFSVLVSLLSGITLFMLAVSDSFHAYAETADIICRETYAGIDVLAGLVAIILEIMSLIFSVFYRIFASLLSLTFWRHMRFQIVTHSWEFGTQPTEDEE